MKLSDKTKIFLYTILSTFSYLIGFIGIVSGMNIRTVALQTIIAVFLFLFLFPFFQYYISKQLKSSGYSQAATGIRYSIFVEVLLLVAVVTFLKNLGK